MPNECFLNNLPRHRSSSTYNQLLVALYNVKNDIYYIFTTC